MPVWTLSATIGASTAVLLVFGEEKNYNRITSNPRKEKENEHKMEKI